MLALTLGVILLPTRNGLTEAFFPHNLPLKAMFKDPKFDHIRSTSTRHILELGTIPSLIHDASILHGSNGRVYCMP
jgi:hypothetical protein